jgi:methylmalonyl-CoA mutase N-terminal domain/subunit
VAEQQALEQGIPKEEFWRELSATFQNDTLKELMARKTVLADEWPLSTNLRELRTMVGIVTKGIQRVTEGSSCGGGP